MSAPITWSIDSVERIENARPRTRYQLVAADGSRATVDRFDAGDHVEIVFAAEHRPHAAAEACRFAAQALDYVGDMAATGEECDMHVDAAAILHGIVRLTREPAFVVTAVYFDLAEELL